MSEAAKAAQNAREEHKEFVRGKSQKYPDFTPELFEIRNNGITFEMLDRLIKKHEPNALYNKRLYDRYTAVWDSVPIQQRNPRYPTEPNPINNKLCNDYFGEIVNFKVGYLAGKPWAYSYAKTDEAKKSTKQKERDAEYIRSLPGGEEAIAQASKALTDFTTRNNMYGSDMEMVTRCSICGYCGRLMYMDGQQARAVATLISCGFPKREAFATLSFVEDPDYIMELIDAEISDEEDYEDLPLEEAQILVEKMQKYIARTEDGDTDAANIT